MAECYRVCVQMQAGSGRAAVKHVADDGAAQAEGMGGVDAELMGAAGVRVEDDVCSAVFRY